MAKKHHKKPKGGRATSAFSSCSKRAPIRFIDTDALIVERAGKSISDIFAQDGEATFRQMEHDIIAEICQSVEPKVVSLGGGALTKPENLQIIKSTGTIIRLWAKPEVLSERIGRKNTRPLLANMSFPRVQKEPL